MNLAELTTKLQTLCHEGYSLDEVLIDIDGKNENYADIEVRRINVLGEKHCNRTFSISSLFF